MKALAKSVMHQIADDLNSDDPIVKQEARRMRAQLFAQSDNEVVEDEGELIVESIDNWASCTLLPDGLEDVFPAPGSEVRMGLDLLLWYADLDYAKRSTMKMMMMLMLMRRRMAREE